MESRTEFYRNPDQWKILENEVFPKLIQKFGKNLKIWKAAVQEQDSGLAPGTVISAGREGLSVQTGQGRLNILELQLEGKKRMEADAFLRGCTLETGAVLG